MSDLGAFRVHQLATVPTVIQPGYYCSVHRKRNRNFPSTTQRKSANLLPDIAAAGAAAANNSTSAQVGGTGGKYGCVDAASPATAAGAGGAGRLEGAERVPRC
jgi:hypothetical protein